MEFILAQVISVLTTAFSVLSMQFKNVKPILLCQLMSNLLCSITYLLLGGFSGAAICLVAILQCIVSFVCNVKDIKPHWLLCVGFTAVYVACSIVWAQSVADVFSAMGAVVFSIGMTQKKASVTRLWYAANPVCWMIYDVFTMAYGNLITHLIIFASTMAAIIRIDLAAYRKNGKKRS